MTAARYRAAEVTAWHGPPDPELRRRIERAVTAGVARAVAAATGDTPLLTAAGRAPVAGRPGSAGQRAPADQAGGAGMPGSASTAAPADRRGRLLTLPSWNAGGGPIAVPVRPAGPGRTGTANAAAADRTLNAGHGDRVVLAAFPRVPVLRITVDDVVHTGGAEYAVSADLGRAFRWGRLLFGALGFAVLEPTAPAADRGFRVVPLDRPLSPGELGRADGAGGRLDLDGVPAERTALGTFWPLPDARVVLIWAQTLLVAPQPGTPWPVDRVLRGLRGTPDGELVRRSDAERVLAAVLADREAAGAAGDPAALLAELVNLDRTVFAVVPWAERARYLALLAGEGRGRRERRVIVELVAAARTELELEAMFALLRERGGYDSLFAALEGDVVELLRILGEWRPPGPASAQYLIDLFRDLGLVSVGAGQDDLRRSAENAAAGLTLWVRSTAEGVLDLFSRPLPELIEGVGQLAEFGLLVARALGTPAAPPDPEAMRTLELLARQAGRAIRTALAGLAYAEQLGTSFGQRGSGPLSSATRIGRDLGQRLRVALAVEVLSWFVGIGEVRAAVRAAGISGHLAEVVELILVAGRAARGARGSAAATRAVRVERLLQALGRAATIRDPALVSEVARLLPPPQLTELGRLADVLDVPADVPVRQLRALARTRSETAAVAELTSALTIASRWERRAVAVGGVTAEMTGALHRLLDTGWPRAGLARLVAAVPETRLAEWSRAVLACRPEHLAALGLDGLTELAYRPRSLRLVAEAGADAYLAALRRFGTEPTLVESLVQGLELRRAEVGSPAEYQRLLDRLAAGEAAAFAEVDRRIGQAAVTARARLAAGRHRQLLAELAESDERVGRLARESRRGDATAAAAARDRLLARIGELSGVEVDGLEQLARWDEASGVVHWDLALDLPAADRGSLLALVAELGGRLPGRALSGVEEVLQPILSRAVRRTGQLETAFQGSWGQLYAARTLLREPYRATGLTFEVWEGPHRKMDILADLPGRGQVSVEVKTNLTGPASEIETEIRRDLVWHAGTEYRQLLYLYHERSERELAALGRRMLSQFDEPGVRRALRDAGRDPDAARAAFERWLAAGNLRTYSTAD